MKCFLMLLCSASACYSQLLLTQAKSSARSQIAMLSGIRGGCAAGIIVGFDTTRVYIATAAHVMPDRSAKTPSGVIVRLDGDLDRNGTFAPTFAAPAKGDLAVVTIPRDADVDRFLGRLDFALVSPDSSIPKDARVYSIGCSGGGRWNTGTNETLRSAQNDNLVFDSDVAEGQSGGGLFNSGWELVGMPFEAGSNGVQAHGITTVLDQLKAWKIPVNLTKRAAANRVGDAETVAREARAVNLVTQAQSLLAGSTAETSVVTAYAMLASKLATPRQIQVRSDAWNVMQRAPFLHPIATYNMDPFEGGQAFFPSPRPNLGVTLKSDGTPAVWDSEGKKIRIQLKRPASGLPVGSEGTIATFGKDKDVFLWAADDGRMREHFAASSPVTSAVFSPDGQWLALESSDNIIHIWNRSETTARYHFAVPGGPHRLRLCANARAVALAGTNGDLKIVSCTGFDMGQVSVGTNLADFTFVPDCTQLIFMEGSGTVRVVAADGGAEIGRLPSPGQQPAAVALSPDGMSAVIVPTIKGEYDPFVIRVLSLVDQRELSWLDQSGSGFDGVDFTADSKGLLLRSHTQSGAGSIASAELYALDLGGREDLLRFAKGKIKTLTFDAAGKQIGIITDGGNVAVVDVQDGKSVSMYDYGVTARAAFSLDVTQVALASSDGTVRVLRLQDRTQRASFKIEGEAADLAFNIAGNVLFVAGANGRLYTLDIPHKKVGTQVFGDGCENGCLKAAFSPGGKWGFFVNDTFAGLQDLTTGKIPSRFNWKYFDTDFDLPTTMVTTADRQRSAVALSQRTAILKTADLPPLDGDLVLRPHDAPDEVDIPVDANALAFSPDGNLLALGSPDGIIRILQLPAGQELVRVNAGSRISVVAITDSGQFAAADEWGRVRIWNTSMDSMRKRLCDSLGSNLSPEQWRSNVYLNVQPVEATCDNWPIP